MKIHHLKPLTLLTLTGCLLMGAVGCSSHAPGDPKPTEPAPAALAKTALSVNGSTSMEKLMTMLSDQYTAKNSHVTLQIQAPGSSAGIKAVMDGSADIGMSSRELKGDELKAGLKVTPIAYDGIAVVTHPSNPVSNLTSQQLQKIFAGEITNWQALGGADQEILLVIREAGSGTRDAFEEILKMSKEVAGKKISTLAEDKAIVADSTNAITQNVAGKENAIGYVSLGSLNPKTTKALALNGVACTVETVKDKTYTLARPFLVLTKAEPGAEIQAFMDYVMSPEGQGTVASEKYIAIGK